MMPAQVQFISCSDDRRKSYALLSKTSVHVLSVSLIFQWFNFIAFLSYLNVRGISWVIMKRLPSWAVTSIVTSIGSEPLCLQAKPTDRLTSNADKTMRLARTADNDVKTESGEFSSINETRRYPPGRSFQTFGGHSP